MTTKQHAGRAAGPELPSRADLHGRTTDKIIAGLEQGVRRWHRPWNAAYLEKRIIRPLRHNGVPAADRNGERELRSRDYEGGRRHWCTVQRVRDRSHARQCPDNSPLPATGDRPP